MIFYRKNVVIEALNSTLHHCNHVYIEHGAHHDEKIDTIIKLAKQQRVQIINTTPKDLKHLTGNINNQGVAVEVSNFHVSTKLNPEESDLIATYLYIYDATYEQNIGAIIRSAEVAGIQGVILPKNTKITGVVASASAGAIFHIPIYSLALFNTIKIFNKAHFEIVGIERGGSKLFHTEFQDQTLFIIGGEDKELNSTVREKCDTIVEIPQFGKVNSLNMSVAASIVLFDKVRQLNS